MVMIGLGETQWGRAAPHCRGGSLVPWRASEPAPQLLSYGGLSDTQGLRRERAASTVPIHDRHHECART
jgi:hypothetical protein